MEIKIKEIILENNNKLIGFKLINGEEHDHITIIDNIKNGNHYTIDGSIIDIEKLTK